MPWHNARLGRNLIVLVPLAGDSASGIGGARSHHATAEIIDWFGLINRLESFDRCRTNENAPDAQSHLRMSAGGISAGHLGPDRRSPRVPPHGEALGARERRGAGAE